VKARRRAQRSEVTLASYRLLFIDDDEAIRKSFALAFEDAPFAVDTAESGERGLALLNDAAYDLVFLDLRMPGMNGAAVLKSIRAGNKEIPVYIVTAFYEEFVRELQAAREISSAADAAHREDFFIHRGNVRPHRL